MMLMLTAATENTRLKVSPVNAFDPTLNDIPFD